MKKLFLTLSLLGCLTLNTACTDEAVTAAGVGAGLIFVASLDNSNYRIYNGNYYYRTPSCSRNFEYFDPSGRTYYPSDCRADSGKYWVSFGTMLVLSLLIYR